MVPLKHFYMIRHGETEANAARIMAGSLDSPLTDNGRRQAREAAGLISALSVRPTLIVHSPLSRARETASIINDQMGLPMVEEAEIAEWHVGDWEGQSYDLCLDLFKGSMDAPNGETFNNFSERVRRAKNRILKRSELSPLIVSHGGVFRAFGNIYGIPAPGVANCKLYEFEPYENETRFPWKVWTYEPINRTPDGYASTPVRRSVDIFQLS